MRIGVLTAHYPVRTETFIFEPLRWLTDAGHEVAVLTRQLGTLAPEADGTRPRLVPGKRVSLGLLAGAVARAPREAARLARRAWRARRGGVRFTFAGVLARALLREVARADVLLAHFGRLGAAWLPVAAVARKPYAVFFHGHDVSEVLKRRPRAYERLFRSGAALIANCEDMKARVVAAGAQPERVVVVRNGVNEDLFADERPPALDSRRLLTIGRLVPKKGIADSITAFARAQDAMRGAWRYAIVGGGELRAELEAHAERLGVRALVDFRGTLSRGETLAELRAASVLVLASMTPPSGDAEGTPNAVIEAATIGLPVVATRHAGLPEILPADAAERGFLVPESDPDKIAAALRRLAQDAALRRSWGEACRAHARALHTPAAHVAALTAALAAAQVPDIAAFSG